MSHAPLISVVLPFMNAEPWLDAALDSLLAQQFRDFELIAIDDGSTDNSSDCLARAESRGLAITAIRHSQNQGIVASLNRGIAAARGRFIARMDADDVCLPQRLLQQVSFLQDNGIDLCGSWFREFEQGPARDVRWPHTEAAVQAAMLFQNAICHPTVLARREVFEQLAYRSAYQLAEDYDLFVRAGLRYRLANVPKVLLHYRRHPGQATQAKRTAMESVTCRVREEALNAVGIPTNMEERRLHHLVRAPKSIRSSSDLEGIEAWLLKVMDHFDHPDAKRTIATQWLRACVRAAPLGQRMWRSFQTSPLRVFADAGFMESIDLRVLAFARLDYASPAFALLRRLGLSA